MSTTNLFRALRDLLPEPALQVATVQAVNTPDGTSTISWPGGDVQKVRGTSVSAGNKAFVRNGVIEGPAPALTAETIEV